MHAFNVTIENIVFQIILPKGLPPDKLGFQKHTEIRKTNFRIELGSKMAAL